MKLLFFTIFAAVVVLVPRPVPADPSPSLFFDEGEEGNFADAYKAEVGDDLRAPPMPAISTKLPKALSDLLFVTKPELPTLAPSSIVRVHVFPVVAHLKGERVLKYFPIEEPGDLYKAALNPGIVSLIAKQGTLHVYRQRDQGVFGDGRQLDVNLTKGSFKLDAHAPQKYQNLAVIQGKNDVTRVEWRTKDGVQGFDYYGSFTIIKDKIPNEKLYGLTGRPCVRVINLVDLERYVADVTPAEMSKEYKIEALKAQAVASRSFVMSWANVRQNLSEPLPYDIYATTQHQSYPGILKEDERTNEAAMATAGVVVVYQKQVAMTGYGQSSGGVTLAIEDSPAGGKPVGYLKSVSEISIPAIRKLPGGTDSAKFSSVDLARKITGLNIGFSDSDIVSIAPVEHNKSQRATALEIRGPRMAAVATGKNLSRLIGALHADGKQVDRYIVSPAIASGGSIEIIYHGKGPQVGMSQYGAIYMAEKGMSYSDILHHFFPNTQLFDSNTGTYDR